ncbi:MAG: AAA family ATPase [Bacteroidaceae bacterium]|nr:AAA family ATPase [Bacteroidales bacterium]MCF0185560.1 AAA family ATPase [Bacteroidaceae bacterium]
MDITLVNFMQEQLSQISLDFKRYMYDKLPWEARLVGLMGPRGVGKSTMVLQHIKEQPDEVKAKSIYVSADNTYFLNHTLWETASQFVREGGQWMYIDEVHKYDNWSIELKQIYDSHPELHVFFTGSSILDIIDGEADLSRRVLLFQMQGLSFREYLEMFHGIKSSVRTFDDVLKGNVQIDGLIHPLPLFNHYLREGYYPFSKEGYFQQRIQQVIQFTMENDIPHFANMTPATGKKLHRMLGIIASNVPYKPEATGLANELKVSRNDISTFLVYMEKAGMIGQLRDKTGGLRGLGKTEKVYLDNTNLIYALSSENANVGNVRETFFYNQTRLTQLVTSSKVSDFEISGYTFEVGGKKKGKRQIKNTANAFVVRDDIEYATENFLPLWSFGLMY